MKLLRKILGIPKSRLIIRKDMYNLAQTMKKAEIPKDQRREYIIGAYTCLGILVDQSGYLNEQINDLFNEGKKGQEIICEIEEREERMDKYFWNTNDFEAETF